MKLHILESGNTNMCLPTLPLDVLIEIFSWDLTKYALFQNLCRETRAAKTPYDGWDSLVAQGHRVEIANDTIKWYKNGNLHRDYDLPAIEYSSGAKFWYQEGDLHREGDLPAIIYGNDIKEWRQRGLLHRDGICQHSYIMAQSGGIKTVKNTETIIFRPWKAFLEIKSGG